MPKVCTDQTRKNRNKFFAVEVLYKADDQSNIA